MDQRSTHSAKTATVPLEIAVVLTEHAWHCTCATPIGCDIGLSADASRLTELEVRLDLRGEVEQDEVYFGPLFRGINEYLAREAINSRYVHVIGSQYRAYAHEADVDGLILIAPDLGSLPQLYGLSDQRKPFIVVSLAADNMDHDLLPCVDSDNCSGAASAIEHLIGLGHRRIGCVNLAANYANHSDRVTGYRRALTTGGVSFDESLLLVKEGYDRDRFEAYIDEWISQLADGAGLPTALFACDFEMTKAVMAVLNRRGIAIPGDMSVVCFDDPYLAERVQPPLTTVRQPVYGLGMWAAQRLIEALRAPGGSVHVMGTDLLRTRLVVRESTARLAK